MTLKTYFRHRSLVILLFRNPAQKAGTANRWETTNSKPLGPIIMIGANGTSNHIISHFFSPSAHCFGCAPFTSYCKLWNYVEPKPFPEPNQHILIFLHQIFMCSVTYWAPLGMVLPLSWFILLENMEIYRDTCDQGFNHFYSIENWAKFSLKKGNFNIKISQEKKIPQKNPEFSKNWKKKFTLRKEKNSVEFALIFFSKTFANLFIQEKNDKFVPKNKNKNKNSLQVVM